MKQGAVSLFLFAFLSIKPQLSLNIDLDCMDVPEAIREGNATFYLIYQFCLDENMCPSNIKKIDDEFIGEKAVSSCLSKWKFKSLNPNDCFTLVLHWRHAVGWDNLSIIGERVEINVKLKK